MTTPIFATDGNDSVEVAEVERLDPFVELGTTGLKRTAGYIDEEFLPQLRGPKAVKVFREMRDNSSVIGALMFAITQLIKNVDWNVKPAGKGKEANDAAKLLETCMDDMSHTWADFVAEVIDGVLTYGWNWNEPVYKRRIGPWQRDGKSRSKYTDGLIGWRKIPSRGQETLQRWAFDTSGDVVAMVQMGAPDYVQRVLPLNRSLLFRWGTRLGNPEGRSMLRNAYEPWFNLKRMQEFEAIGVERDLAGLPKVGVPASYLSALPGTAQNKQVEAMKRLVRGVRRNEQEGIVFPLAYDKETKQPLFTFDLVTSGGSRQYDTNAIIERKKTEMLMTCLADWIMVGHEQSTGTYNMHVDKTGIFKTALNSAAKVVADIINGHAVPRLFAMNGWRLAELPKIVPGDVDSANLTELSAFLTQTAALGLNWNDADMIKFLRQAANLPELSDSEMTAAKRTARMQEATRLAQTQTEYLAARSTLAQQTAAAQMQAEGEPQASDVAEAQSLAGGAQAQQQGQANEQRTQEAHDMSQSAAAQQQDLALGNFAQTEEKNQADAKAKPGKPKPKGK